MKFYVLSDSHSRSFAYNDLFIPLFIGPGKTNLFLTDQQFNNTFNKIKVISSRFKPRSKIIFALSEPNFRFYNEDRETFSENENEICELIVKRQHQVVEFLFSKGFEVFWMEAIPRRDLDYSKIAVIYNAKLNKYKDSNSFKILNFFKDTTNENLTIKDKYFGDFIHCNYELGNLIANKLGVINSDFSWTYFHKILIDNYQISIWGDFPKEKLIMHEKEPRNWKDFQQLTKSTELAASLINRIFKRLKIKSARIFNVKEGWVLNQIDLESFTLVESHEEYHEYYDYINFYNKKFEFSNDSNLIALDLDPSSDIILEDNYIRLNKIGKGTEISSNYFIEFNVNTSYFKQVYLKIDINIYLLKLKFLEYLRLLYVRLLK